MKGMYPSEEDHLLQRVLWLYGVYMLITNTAFLFGYYLLPEGSLRRGPQSVAGHMAASADSFAAELLLTLLFNVGVVVTVAIVMNLNRVRCFPVGYIYPIFLGIVSGLIPGTNSFVASDLAGYTVREGMALSLTIGNLEMLGYICVIAATVRIHVYEYRSWWRWGDEWKAIKTKSLRDIRLSRTEWATVLLGIGFVALAAVRETLMAQGGLSSEGEDDRTLFSLLDPAAR